MARETSAFMYVSLQFVVVLHNFVSAKRHKRELNTLPSALMSN
jgi:hypothetical protein